MFKKFIHLFFLIMLSSGVYAEDAGMSGYSCPPKTGAVESTFKSLSSGRFQCVYTFENGSKATYEFQNPQRNSSMAKEIAAMQQTDPDIMHLPLEKQKQAAAEKILRARGLDPSQAAGIVEYIDKNNDAQIEEAINNVFGNGASSQADALSSEAINKIKNTIDYSRILQNVPSKSINATAEDLDSHTNYDKTIPAILMGVLTLDPDYFANNGKVSYINSAGETDISPDHIQLYNKDHSKDSPIGRLVPVMSEFFYKPENVVDAFASFNPVNFMDQQVLGFATYLFANIHTAYMDILYLIFLSVLGIFTIFTLSRTVFHKFLIMRDQKEGDTRLFKQEQKNATQSHHNSFIKGANLPAPRIYAVAFALFFFIAPVFKSEVDTSSTSPLSKAVYRDSAVDSTKEYSYTTPAQELLRFSLQLGNYYGNTLNDYGMKAYLALINFKMGFVKESMPRYIGKLQKDIAQLEKDKADLAASSALYNKACEPYKNGDTYSIPSNALNTTNITKAVSAPKNLYVIGDQLAVNLSAGLRAKGIQNTSSAGNGYSIDNMASAAKTASDNSADYVIMAIGLNDLKDGGRYSGGTSSDEWVSTYRDKAINALSPARDNGARTACVIPPKGTNSNYNIRIGALEMALAQVCDSVMYYPALKPEQLTSDGVTPNADGYLAGSDSIASKLSGVGAQRIDATACKKLESEIKTKSAALLKSATMIQEGAETAKSFSENIKQVDEATKRKDASSPYPSLTEDPSKVNPANRKVHGSVDTFTYGYSKGEMTGSGNSNNKSGYFAVPMGVHSPGWSAVGTTSVYGKAGAAGKFEAGTTDTAASGANIRQMQKAGAVPMAMANWHLPLNTIVEVTGPTGQKFHVRIIDRGPLVVFDKDGNRLTAPKNNPWKYSTKFMDLLPPTESTMCAMTGDRLTMRILKYNAPKGYNPPQPSQNPDGTVRVLKCEKKRKLAGQGLTNTFGPTNSNNGTYYSEAPAEMIKDSPTEVYEYVMVDDSPVRNMKDFVKMIAFINKNFGWMSVAMVPTSYQFFKYINVFFVQDGAGNMTELSDIYAERAQSEYEKTHGTGEENNILGVAEYMYSDMLIQNSVWFIVPGFNGVYNMLSKTMSKYVLIPDKSLDVNAKSGGSIVVKGLISGVLGAMINSAGGFGMASDGGSAVFGIAGAAASMIALLSGNVLAIQIAIGIAAFVMAIAISVMIIGMATVLIVTTLLIIKIIVYFIEAILFFISAPAIGIVAAFDKDPRQYVFKYFSKLFVLSLTPVMIVIPGYLFVPIDELFKGFFMAMGNLTLSLFEIGLKTIASDAGVIAHLKAVTAIAAMQGLFSLFGYFMTLIVVFIFIIKFRTWVLSIIGSREQGSMYDAFVSDSRDRMQKIMAPL